MNLALLEKPKLFMRRIRSDRECVPRFWYSKIVFENHRSMQFMHQVVLHRICLSSRKNSASVVPFRLCQPIDQEFTVISDESTARFLARCDYLVGEKRLKGRENLPLISAEKNQTSGTFLSSDACTTFFLSNGLLVFDTAVLGNFTRTRPPTEMRPGNPHP